MFKRGLRGTVRHLESRLRNILSCQPFIPIELSCSEELKEKNRKNLRYIDGSWMGPKLGHYFEELMTSFPMDVTKMHGHRRVWDDDSLDKYAIETITGKRYSTDVSKYRHSL